MGQNRLSFRLPDFLRCAWVSDEARNTWQPKLEAIRDAWPEAAISMVADGLAECALRTVPPRMIFRLQAAGKRRGLAVEPLGVRGMAVPGHASESPVPEAGTRFLYDVAFGVTSVVREMESLWERRDYAAVYRLAGFPECCIAALQRDIETRRIDAIGRLAESAGSTELESGAMADPFWQWMNIERLAGAPCSLACARALEKSMLWMNAAAHFGYRAEMDSLRDVFSWPVEWSALHGIAELKTPVIKATWTTDATNEKIVLRRRGDGYPQEGATGLGFPYRQPGKATLTSSSGFQRGLDNLIQIG